MVHIYLGDFLILLIILFVLGIFLGFYLTVAKNVMIFEHLSNKD